MEYEKKIEKDEYFYILKNREFSRVKRLENS